MTRLLGLVLGFCLLSLGLPALRAEEQVIYPRTAAPAAAPAPRPASSYSPLLLGLALAAAATGGWLLWRQRRQGGGLTGAARKLAVTETRSLGSRQYLVVADYDGRKFLLGVCPGRIDLLAPLDEAKK